MPVRLRRGTFYGDFQDMGDPARYGIVEGAVLDFVVQRSGTTFTISVNGNVVQTHTSSEPITSIGLRPHRATMQLYDWTVDWCRSWQDVMASVDVAQSRGEPQLHLLSGVFGTELQSMLRLVRYSMTAQALHGS